MTVADIYCMLHVLCFTELKIGLPLHSNAKVALWLNASTCCGWLLGMWLLPPSLGLVFLWDFFCVLKLCGGFMNEPILMPFL